MTNDDFDDAIRVTVANFCDWIAKTSEEQVKTWPNGAKLIGLAQELCVSASPYAGDVGGTSRITLGLSGGQVTYDVKRTVAMQMPVRPAWWHFLPEAKIALDYLGADVPSAKAVDFMKAVREIAKP